MKKAIWYTLGWQWLGLKARFLMWLIREMYRLRLISEEMVKEYVEIVKNATLVKKIKAAGLKTEIVKIEEKD